MATLIRKVKSYKRNGKVIKSHRQRYHIVSRKTHTKRKAHAVNLDLIKKNKIQWGNVSAAANTAAVLAAVAPNILPNSDNEKLKKAQLEEIQHNRRILSRFNRQNYERGELEKKEIEARIKLLETQRNRL